MNRHIQDLARQAEEPYKRHLHKQRLDRQDRELFAFALVCGLGSLAIFGVVFRAPIRAFLGW